MAGDRSSSRVLYIVACAAPPAGHVEVLIQLAQDAGWRVCLIATPSALPFLNVPVLESLTGYPVRSSYKRPEQPDAFPPSSAIVVAPATFNTVNKWAAGISDTLALGLLTEAIGKGLPIVALPFLNRAQAAHPAFQRSVDQLRSWGVRLLYGPDVLPLHEPGTGTQRAHLFPWQRIFDELEQLMAVLSRSPFQNGDSV
jgi:phosphopantothenoylcysteine decarboxylase